MHGVIIMDNRHTCALPGLKYNAVIIKCPMFHK